MYTANGLMRGPMLANAGRAVVGMRSARQGLKSIEDASDCEAIYCQGGGCSGVERSWLRTLLLGSWPGVQTMLPLHGCAAPPLAREQCSTTVLASAALHGRGLLDERNAQELHRAPAGVATRPVLCMSLISISHAGWIDVFY